MIDVDYRRLIWAAAVSIPLLAIEWALHVLELPR